jgi:hypothetical protein
MQVGGRAIPKGTKEHGRPPASLDAAVGHQLPLGLLRGSHITLGDAHTPHEGQQEEEASLLNHRGRKSSVVGLTSSCAVADSINAGWRPRPTLKYDEAGAANPLPQPAICTNCR